MQAKLSACLRSPHLIMQAASSVRTDQGRTAARFPIAKVNFLPAEPNGTIRALMVVHDGLGGGDGIWSSSLFCRVADFVAPAPNPHSHSAAACAARSTTGASTFCLG